MHTRIVVHLALAVLMFFAISPAASAQFTPDLFVIDQPVIDGTVNITRATMNEDGWIAIHIQDDNGSIGRDIGAAFISAGISGNIKVEIDVLAATDTLYAMLHIDSGVAGEYDGPTDDPALIYNDAPITPSFETTGLEYTVVGTAINADDFNTLVTALEAAGLSDTLRGDGPFTVFAPTDAAFDALPEGTVEALLEDPDTLAEILQYHVVAGATSSDSLEDGMELETLQGDIATISLREDGASINDANIIAADIEAYNGVIHVIDTVILPPASEDEEAMAEEAPAEEGSSEEGGSEEASEESSEGEEADDSAEAMAEGGNIVDTAINADSFDVLVAGLEAADLVDALSGEGPFTVFAPSDEAFTALPEGTLEALLEDTETLSEILLYHVIPSRVLSNDIGDGLVAGTLQGATLEFNVSEDGTVSINDGSAQVTAVDMDANNGVIHTIDAVLLPPSVELGIAEAAMDVEAAAEAPAGETDESEATEEEAAAEEESSEAEASEEAESEESADDIVAIASNTPEFSTLVELLNQADLATALMGEGPFTVFAPTNDAFNGLPEGTLEALMADSEKLSETLLYHVVPGRIFAADIGFGLEAGTLQGSTIRFIQDAGGTWVNDKNTQIILTDIEASNGVIHVIDAVLTPPSDMMMDEESTPDPEPSEEMAEETAEEAPASPEALPRTGVSLKSAPSKIAVVIMTMLALIGTTSLFGRRKDDE